MGNKLSSDEVRLELEMLNQILGPLLDSTYYERLSSPEKYDWLSINRERGQSVEKYLNSRPNKPDQIRNVIYVAPIDIDTSLLIDGHFSLIIRYLETFFQMKVSLLENIKIRQVTKRSRRNEYGEIQYLTEDILSSLKDIVPGNAFCLMGLTTKDLYSNDSYAFVFGESSYYERVGMLSVARLSPSFYKRISKEEIKEALEIYKIDLLKCLNNDSLINRSLKMITHEILHMFGMDHCIYYNCLMCGNNGLPELDRWSFSLCPICIQKLYIAYPFNVFQREKELVEFYNMTDIISEYNRHKLILNRFSV